jgi:hypothetical protein
MSDINSPAARLFLAIDKGNTEAVEEILSQGFSPNARPNKSYPLPLHQAVLTGNAAITDRLLAYGAEVNAICPVMGATPLFAASALGHKSIARTLIGDGGALNQPDILGNTPLMVATLGGHLPIARALIEAGCDIHAKNSQGITALDIDHAAISHLAGEEFPEPLTATLPLKAGLAGVQCSVDRVQNLTAEYLRKVPAADAAGPGAKPARAFQPPSPPAM